MEKQLIIGVDTGNRCIKTASQIFVAGLKQSNDRMPFNHGVMEYNNKYYMLSQKRVSYLQDKTQTDEYFILTLFAIAKELDYRKADTNGTVHISLGVGLPPSHLLRLKDKFKQYFSNRGIISFSYNNKQYQLQIDNVTVFSQGYAAIFMDFRDISKFDRSYIIDIGGYTTDIISLNRGVIDPEFCQSLDIGLIHLYNKIAWAVREKYGNAPNEDQIDTVIKTNTELSEKTPILPVINQEAELYIADLIRKLTEYGIDLVFSKGIFVGGGSERFKPWIERADGISNPYFINNVHANAQGYEALLNAIRNRR